MRIIPSNVFSKQELPKTLPKDALKIVSRLQKAKSREDCLRSAYDEIIKRFHGEYFRTIIGFFRIFEDDFSKLWNKKGWQHCHTLCFFLRVLLIKSGWFKEEDIVVKWTLIFYISPHQYLKVRASKNNWIAVDLWAASHKKPFGKYAKGFY